MPPTSSLTQARTKVRPPKTSPRMAMILHPCSRLQPQQQVETLILVSSSSLYKFWNGNRDSVFNQFSLRVARNLHLSVFQVVYFHQSKVKLVHSWSFTKNSLKESTIPRCHFVASNYRWSRVETSGLVLHCRVLAALASSSLFQLFVEAVDNDPQVDTDP